MSSMLEQAIIDANELKEAAIHNAETALIEKYSADIKDAVEQLLEQGPPPDMGMAPPEMGAPPMAPPGPPPGPPVEPPFSQQVPLGATEGEELCPCPEKDQPMTIDLDQLAYQLQTQDPGSPVSSEAIAADLMGPAGAPAPPQEGEEQFLVQESVLMDILEGEDLYEEDSKDDDREHAHHASGDEEEHGKKRVLEVDLDEELALYENDTDEDLREEEDLYENDTEEDLYETILKELELYEEEDLYEEVEDNVPSNSSSTQGSPGTPTPAPTTTPAPATPATPATPAAPATPTPGPVGEGPATVATAGAAYKRDDLQERLSAYHYQYSKLYESYARYEKEYENLHNQYTNNEKNFEKLFEEKEKYKNYVSQVVEKLNEANISNAKLFYTNRVLDSDSLNERQRDKIVEAVSNANSVEEAKTIFETLQSTVVGTGRNKTAPKSLNEAVSRSSSAFLPHREVKDSDPSLMSRMQKLAGITKE